MSVVFFVPGHPKARPNPRPTIRNGRPCLYSPDVKGLALWRSAVRAHAKNVAKDGGQIAGPVIIQIAVRILRPNAHYRTGKFYDHLTPSAPPRHISKPDFDNLAKPIVDELVKGGLIEDDAKVCSCALSKYWAKTSPGALIKIIRPDSETSPWETHNHDQKPIHQ